MTDNKQIIFYTESVSPFVFFKCIFKWKLSFN